MTEIESIWKKYHNKLFIFLKNRVSEDVAEDILQDVFLKIHNRIDTLKENSKLESWLYQITRNAVIDYYRDKKPTVNFPLWIEQPQTEESETARQELSSCLEPMIEQLPEKYRVAIILSEIDQKTQKEVAELEKISLSGAKSRVQRGRALLKTMLQDCCKIEINQKNQVYSYIKKNKGCNSC